MANSETTIHKPGPAAALARGLNNLMMISGAVQGKQLPEDVRRVALAQLEALQAVLMPDVMPKGADLQKARDVLELLLEQIRPNPKLDPVTPHMAVLARAVLDALAIE
ncbi:MAG: hypothetical protein HRU17_24060 [Polyangiaceae bacterium]|nr:hypothetical protein [Polyangiaceae bacterium]